MLRKTTLAGNPFYYLSDDKHIGQRIALGKYEPYLTEVIMDNIGEGEIVVDVGANIGYYSILMAEKAKKVYSFEPEEKNFEILKKNVKASGCNNIKLVKAAVGNRVGEVKLKISAKNYGAHFIGQDGISVNMTTLDEELKNESKVHLIKSDAQGSEPEVFLGASEIIKKNKPTVIFEYWPKGIKQVNLCQIEMFTFLKQIYSKVYFIDEYTQVYFPVKESRLKKLIKRNRREDCNLIVKKVDVIEFFHQFKNFSPKKYLKRALKVYSLT